MSATELVTNNETSHLDELIKLFSEDTKHIIITSPFLAKNMSSILDNINFQKIETFELITTFKPKDKEQLTKPFSIKQIFDYFKNNNIKTELKIHISNELHGKAYISKRTKQNAAIVTSANLTTNGLTKNKEWGILTEDNRIIDKLENEIFESIEYCDLTYNQICKAVLFAKQYESEHPDWIAMPDIFSDILESVYSVDDKNNSNTQYFLKPIGTSEYPINIEDKTDYSHTHENLHFSKKGIPKSIRKGDCVIVYAIPAGAVVSYYKVTGGAQKSTLNEIKLEPWKERWPWFVESRNISPRYGEVWWRHNIKYKDLLKEFLNKHPETPATYAGGRTLGTLNFGSDNVHITKEFGEFLISKINSQIEETS